MWPCPSDWRVCWISGLVMLLLLSAMQFAFRWYLGHKELCCNPKVVLLPFVQYEAHRAEYGVWQYPVIVQDYEKELIKTGKLCLAVLGAIKGET